MRQLTVVDKGRIEWREAPEPQLLSAGGAIVRPVAVAVCDFDRAVVTGNYPALPLPIAIGHEMVAEVVETGADVHSLQVGARVVLPLQISCGGCPSCQARRTNSCTSRPPLSNFGLGARGGDWGGAMSDLVYVPYADAMAAPLPRGATPVDCAAVGCNLVDLHRTLAPHLDSYVDPTVLIVGGRAHNMALYGVVMAQALGVTRVDFLDDDPQRLAAAEALGARPLNVSERGGDLYPIVVDCSGIPERLALALSRVGPGGVCTSVWPHTGSFELPVGAMFLRNATLITGQPHALANMEPVLALIGQGRLSSTCIPVEILPWDDADKTFGFGERKRIFVRD